MDAKQMGAFIQMVRKENGQTQKALAEEMHVTEQAISRWERGVGYPDIGLLEPLANALGIGVDELINTRRKDESQDNETVIDAIRRTIVIACDQINGNKIRSFMISEIVLCVLGTLSLFLAALSYYNTYYLLRTLILEYWNSDEVAIQMATNMPYGYYLIYTGLVLLVIAIIRMVVYVIRVNNVIKRIHSSL